MKAKLLCVALGVFVAAASMAAGTPASKSSAAAKVMPPPAMTKNATDMSTAGKVWANTNSKIYHCQDSANFGTTKMGEYMSEADAQAKGFQPARGKACAPVVVK